MASEVAVTIEALSDIRWGQTRLKSGKRLVVAAPLAQILIAKGLAGRVLPDGSLKRRRGRPRKAKKKAQTETETSETAATAPEE